MKEGAKPYKQAFYDKELINPVAMVEGNSIMYCITRRGNIVYKYDMSRDDGLDTIEIPWLKLNSFYPYSQIFYHDKKLYLLPYFEKNICVVDLTTRNMYCIDSPCNLIKCYFELDKEIIAFGESSQVMLFDFDKKKVSVIDMQIHAKPYFHSSICRIGDEVYIPANEIGSLIIYNIKSKKSFIAVLDAIDFNICGISYDGKYAWIIGDSCQIVRWNPSCNEIMTYDLSGFWKEDVNVPWRDPFSNCILLGNDIYLTPLLSKKFLKISLNDMRIEELYEIEEGSIIWNMFPIGNDCFYMTKEEINGNSIEGLTLNIHTKRINYCASFVNEIEKRVVIEGKFCTLNDFLDYL